MQRIDEADAVATRDLVLDKVPDACTGSRWAINGLGWDDITEMPALGTSEVWRFWNRSGAVHPMHMHLVMFQVLDRQPIDIVNGQPVPIGNPVPAAPEEAGWKESDHDPESSEALVIGIGSPYALRRRSTWRAI